MPSEGSNAVPSTASTTTLTDDLIYHARVNNIADYYDVKGLAEISTTRIRTLLETSWSADAFCDLIRETGSSVGDRDLLKVLAQCASSNIVELMKKDSFSEENISSDWAAILLRETANVLENTQLSNQQMKAQVQAQVEAINSLNKDLNEIAAVLSSESICPTSKCKVGFNIKLSSLGSKKRWVIYCPSCNRRYIYVKTLEGVVETEIVPRTAIPRTTS